MNTKSWRNRPKGETMTSVKRYVGTFALVVCISVIAQVADEKTEPQRLSELKWDFESGTLEGWTIVSDNLGKQPSSNDNDRWTSSSFNKHGKYFLGTFEDAGPCFNFTGDHS